ncbi:hypothetical protein HOO54_11535 [Bacillus sp. WMMC1349]|uniref:hypothetical protein n=1 Tax=Bacillus sp. WMMC1349 TaxID=2736254 RepID=UPI0015560904|nr:hypothetical protein [Bacillus sp. WMMC1349]NPC92846.1 hypothetical protein [Bacillus sp. WMMC1349]
MNKSKIIVKIKNDGNAMKYIPIIRSFTKESISTIKQGIENKQPIFICHYIENSEGMPKMYQTLKNLQSYGAQLYIRQESYQSSRVISLDVIKNLIMRDREIATQLQEIDDLFD